MCINSVHNVYNDLWCVLLPPPGGDGGGGGGGVGIVEEGHDGGDLHRGEHRGIRTGEPTIYNPKLTTQSTIFHTQS